MSIPHPEASKLLPSSSDEEGLQFHVDDVEAGDDGIDLSNTVNILHSKGMSSPRSNESNDALPANKESKVAPKNASPLRLSVDQFDFPCTGIPGLDEGNSTFHE